jgi:hypothetical protein
MSLRGDPPCGTTKQSSWIATAVFTEQLAERNPDFSLNQSAFV